MILCHSHEGTAFAKNKLRVNDCAFILRSGGLFTYAKYEGHPENDPTLLSFQVSTGGHFKVIPAKQFLSRVKIPVLPVMLIGSPMDKYSMHLNDEEEVCTEAETALTGLRSTSADKIAAASKKMSRSRSTGMLTHLSKEHEVKDSVGMEENVVGTTADEAKVKTAASGTRSTSAGKLAGGGTGACLTMSRSTSVGTLQQLTTPPASNDAKPTTSLGGLTLNKPTATDAPAAVTDTPASLPRSTSMGQLAARRSPVQQKQLPSSGEFARRSSLPGTNMLQQVQPYPSDGLANFMVTAQKHKLGTRVASMQNFRQKMTTVPELQMNSPNNDPFTLTRNNNSASVSSLVTSRSASMGQFNNNNNNRSGMMPRNVTLRRINEVEPDNNESGNSSNASWVLASDTARTSLASENPLLKMMAQKQQQQQQQQPQQTSTISSDNPLLKMMAQRQEIPKQQQQPQQQAVKSGSQSNSNSSLYSIGARISAEDMLNKHTNQNESETKLAKLQINDYAFVKRSDKSWAYSRVVSKNTTHIVFEVNANGDKKTFDLDNAMKYVKVLDEKGMEEAGNDNDMRIGSVINIGQSSNNEQQQKQLESASGAGGDEEKKVAEECDEPETLLNEIAKKVSSNNLLQQRGSAELLQQQQQQQKKPSSHSYRPTRRRGSDPPEEGEGMMHVNGNSRPVPRRSSASQLSSMMFRTTSESAMSAGSGGTPAGMGQRRRSSTSTNSMMPRTMSGNMRVGTTSRRSSSTRAVENDAATSTANADWGEFNNGNAKPQMMPGNKLPSTSPIQHLSMPSSTNTSNNTSKNNVFEVPQVQCKTEDGKTKMVPMYKVGMGVYYKRQNEGKLLAKILEVHLDDLLEPYYTIKLEDGREKQTDNDHITLRQ